ncbi:TrkH family potassium uptake protein [Haloarcula nitratireducens]|uniref:TrkH family potassium uptake protein n=1 Tax=Haloarcula nitratireducens TaxID=2487749 RepID=A0AAW4PD14_9EURY|nr:TrkH family potassium uptake protein [Halomicroarcula nitratireducens]MBX0295325.1 TrkH family potassium uptake protein [Halomicroarcula nitratireducens]
MSGDFLDSVRSYLRFDVQTHVDYRTSLGFVGLILKYLAAAPLFPTAVALYYGESPVPFLVTSGVMFGLGVALGRLRTGPELGNREAFLLVGLTWLVVPLVGMLPYLIAGNGTVAHPVNALFESMSGFTTTGSTVLSQISFERHPRSILMWRQLTQWIGGMGILVLMIAILPELSVGGAQIMSEEAPGVSIDKLTPRIQNTARTLWKIYIGFTVAAAGALYALNFLGLADMSFYNAVAHALTTLPTGGFSPEARSIEPFSPAVQWTIIAFMIVAGTNFALFWYAFSGRPEKLLRNVEFRSYLSAMVVVSGVLAVLLFTGLGLAEVPDAIPPLPGDVERSVRQAVFQVVSIVTTTGYASMDFNTWDQSTQLILLTAMFLGGSAGSAAGSVKIIRWYTIRKTMARELFTSVHPEAVRPVTFSEEMVDEETVRSVLVFTILFLTIFAFSSILIYLDSLRIGLDISAIEAVSASIATLGNVGPGVGVVGPMNNFLRFSAATKLYMIFLMWLGRLEILSVLVLFTPSYWRR